MTAPPIIAVAPMMDRTDRHCRFLHRLLSPHALLYTEMVTAEAVLRGDRQTLLRFHPAEHPVVLQLGGSDPVRLAEAAATGEAFGYDEINLNVGCPSDRVKAGRFGACLMREPNLVASAVSAMKRSVHIPVTVKCRIGVDDQDIEGSLDAFIDAIVAAGVDGVWVHARKAWLQGLDPKQNRTVPPLDYDRVYRLKQRLPDLFVGINGGIVDAEAVEQHLGRVDGVMIGRAAYDRPALLAELEHIVFGASTPSEGAVAIAMSDYARRVGAEGTPIHHVTRHLSGMFRGLPGARSWRRALSDGAAAGGGAEIILEALHHVSAGADARSDRAILAA